MAGPTFARGPRAVALAWLVLAGVAVATPARAAEPPVVSRPSEPAAEPALVSEALEPAPVEAPPPASEGAPPASEGAPPATLPSAIAGEPMEASDLPPPSSGPALAPSNPGTRQLIIGGVIMAVGGQLAIIGAVSLAALEEFGDLDPLTPGTGQGQIMLGATIAGAVVTLIGLPIMTVGVARNRRARRLELSWSPVWDGRSAGLGLRGRF